MFVELVARDDNRKVVVEEIPESGHFEVQVWIRNKVISDVWKCISRKIIQKEN